jgi:hypothetical protein
MTRVDEPTRGTSSPSGREVGCVKDKEDSATSGDDRRSAVGRSACGDNWSDSFVGLKKCMRPPGSASNSESTFELTRAMQVRSIHCWSTIPARHCHCRWPRMPRVVDRSPDAAHRARRPTDPHARTPAKPVDDTSAVHMEALADITRDAHGMIAVQQARMARRSQVVR